MNAERTGDWVCKCRRGHGVHNTADAVQYAYELWNDDPQQALVLAFAPFGEAGRWSLTVPFLDGEPACSAFGIYASGCSRFARVAPPCRRR
jgi:hypothetical protein